MPLILIPDTIDDAYGNMAVDLNLLKTAPAGTALFRHYDWRYPSMTFGYAQHYHKVKFFMDSVISICRRPSGGGIVNHLNDWTYTIVINSEFSAYKLPPIQIYTSIHKALSDVLLNYGIHSKLEPCKKKCNQIKKDKQPDICFKEPSPFDLTRLDGGKIAGAAMRRTKNGLLIQGSVDRTKLSANFNYNTLGKQFSELLATRLKLGLLRNGKLADLIDESIVRSDTKLFSSNEWLQKR